MFRNMQLKATNSQNVSQSLEKVNKSLIGLITTKTSQVIVVSKTSQIPVLFVFIFKN